MTDITGISKVLPLEKLLDVLSSAVGRVSKSYYDRKDADSKAYEIRKIAEAKAYELKLIERTKTEIENQLEPEDKDFIERTENRILFKELKKQENIENIANVAAEQLRNEKEVSQEPVDDDWKTRFFNYAEDVSNEEMQKLWGRILAGEIKRPKTFSLRTLEFIKNLSKEEADIFTKIGRLSLFSTGKYFIKEDVLKNIFNITLDETLSLKELGLLNFSELGLELKPEKNSDLLIISGQRGLIIKRLENGTKRNINGTVFTKLGAELLKLITIDYKEELFRDIKEKISSDKTLDFKICNTIKINDETIYVNNIVDFK